MLVLPCIPTGFTLFVHLQFVYFFNCWLVIAGSDGSGKTLALSQVVWYCAKTNWICVHVPSGQCGSHGGV